MKRLLPILLALALAAHGCRHATPGDRLLAGFQDPPVSARPKAYLTFVNGNFDLAEIRRELEEAKRMGMGGFDIWDVGVLVDPDSVIPAGPPFMGRESVEAIAFAVREGKRLGLEMGLVAASSWNDGGPWVKPEDGVMGLFRSELTVSGPARFAGELPFPEISRKMGRLRALLDLDERGIPRFYRDVAVLAYPDSARFPRSAVIDLSDSLSPDGWLSWQVPPGRWRIVRYVCFGTGQPLAIPSPNSNGLVVDHFSARAMERHLNVFFQRLEAVLGPLGQSGLRYLYSDSYEANSASWTPGLVQIFRERRGYDPLPYLPVLDGCTVESPEISQRFLFDFHKLLSDLIIENHYRKGVELCREHGIGYRAEAGGPGAPVHNCPFEDLKALGAVDVPRGEFWYNHPAGKKHMEELQVIKGPASAAHLYGKRQVEAEAFTSVWLWQESPRHLKPLADRALCEGLNRFVYHTFPHTPPEAGSPGWVYNFGTLIYPKRAWWPLSRPFHDYLARCSFLLQQGLFVAHALYYYGDRAPNFVKPKHLRPDLGPGYDYDVVNSDVILNRLAVKNGRLVLPHGQSYSVLVLPSERRANPEVLEKIAELVRGGATVIGPPPEKAYSLRDYPHRDERVRRLAAKLWGECDSVRVQERRVGRGRIVWGKTARQVLAELGIPPDVEVIPDSLTPRLDWIHRRDGETDIYFLRNRSKRRFAGEVRFRVQGKQPEVWDPETGETADVPVFTLENSRVRLPLCLEGEGSVFVIFRRRAPRTAVRAVLKDGRQVFPTDGAAPRSFTCSRGRLIPLEAGTFVMRRADGRADSFRVDSPGETVPVGGPWEVHFPFGWDAQGRTVFPELISWTEAKDPGIRTFSGVAKYCKTVVVDGELLQRFQRVVLDLGEVREMARVFVNGRSAGTAWHAPFRVEVTSLLRPGENDLTIYVANLLHNRLVGDARRPKRLRRTHTNITRLPNAWMDPMAEVPPKPSGLLGPVRLEFQRVLSP